MLTLMVAQQALDAARDEFYSHPTAQARLEFDQALAALVRAEARLNVAIRTNNLHNHSTAA